MCGHSFFYHDYYAVAGDGGLFSAIAIGNDNLAIIAYYNNRMLAVYIWLYLLIESLVGQKLKI